jgi:BirA family biotin operon repressor/biotin-[acetyl-CoA-carboxylase] ligase
MHRLVEDLRTSAGPLSGAAEARRLGVTRAALWKYVGVLRRMGYVIDAAPRAGYRLISAPDRPYPWEVRAGLRTKRFGQQVHYRDVTASTQDDCRELAERGAPEGTLVVAERQESARGRLGREYFTPPGGLWFSLLLRPERAPEEVILLSLVAAIAVHAAVEEVTGLRPTIRWPNDLLLDGRKIAGILVELASEQDVLRYVILGVGINVNLRQEDFPEELRPIAASIREVIGRDAPRVALLQRLLERLEALYDRYLAEGPKPVLDAWLALPNILGQRVTVYAPRETWSGVATGLDEEGALLVRTEDGSVRRVVAGDVRLFTEPPPPPPGRPKERT